MKSKALILILFLPLTTLFSQDYIPLIDTTIYWDIGEYSMGHICGYSDFNNPKRYFFKGDTIIKTKNYKKVYAYDFKNFNNNNPICPPFEIDTISYLTDILIREDIETKKVFRHTYSEEDELLYDFNLAIGDTFHNSVYGDIVVDTVYYVTTTDGINRKCISFNKNCINCGDRFIEGIGGPQGPFELPFELFENGYFVMCIKDNTGIIEGSSCYDFITSIKDKSIREKINVYPIPVKELLYIDFNDLFGSKQIKIINSLGQVVNTYQTDKTKLEIDISNTISGFFFISIIINNNKVTNYKVIKK